MKNILMIGTGGTIASKDSGQGLTPAITSEEILGAGSFRRRYFKLYSGSQQNL